MTSRSISLRAAAFAIAGLMALAGGTSGADLPWEMTEQHRSEIRSWHGKALSDYRNRRTIEPPEVIEYWKREAYRRHAKYLK